MKIDLKKEHQNSTVEITGTIDDLEITPDGFSTEGDIHIVCTIHHDMDLIRINGTVTASAVLECSRCLEPFRQDITGKFSLVVRHLTKGETEPGISGDFKDEGDESLIYISHDEDSVDITEFVHDALLLSIPLKPVCSSSCKGLCSVCGNNRNERECECTRSSSDPRWSALSGIFDNAADNDKNK